MQTHATGVVVAGGGLAGIVATLELLDAGKKVYCRNSLEYIYHFLVDKGILEDLTALDQQKLLTADRTSNLSQELETG